jgi:MFS transporter, PAT family, beta-lactamase induction signal transducer AmpG
MNENRSTPPPAFCVLMLPVGLSNGFISVTLPFALTEAGFSVAATASIVAVGLSAIMWTFLWGPLVDLTLTLRRWYFIGVSASALSLLALGFMPLRENVLLPGLVLLSQIAATWILPPVGGLMAHTVADPVKGRAAGWFSAGLLSGTGLGGGMGVWLVDNFSLSVSGAATAIAMLLCLAGLQFVPAVRGASGETFGDRMMAIQRDFRDMLKSAPVLLVVGLSVVPIGIGAASRLWSAVAADWSATPETVALVTGVLSALMSVAGSVLGGSIAVRFGRWIAFLGAGGSMALVTLVMAALPRTPEIYVAGVLLYAFTMGLSFAGFGSVVLHAIGRGAASTKFAIFQSLGVVPAVYLTPFDGWTHDHFGAVGMLTAEALLGIGFIALAIAAVVKFGGEAPERDVLKTEEGASRALF